MIINIITTPDWITWLMLAGLIDERPANDNSALVAIAGKWKGK